MHIRRNAGRHTVPLVDDVDEVDRVDRDRERDGLAPFSTRATWSTSSTESTPSTLGGGASCLPAAEVAGVAIKALRAGLRIMAPLVFGVVAMLGVIPLSHAQNPIQLGTGLEYGVMLQGSNGEANLVIDLNAATPAGATQRPPISVALVIDRSGSMAGGKMSNAIAAASSFIRSLRVGDVVAVYAYDDVVEQIAPPTPVNAATTPGLLRAVTRLYPRGSTNLHDGLAAGIEALQTPLSERPIRRVIVVSDGLANVGPSDPFSLGELAAQAARSAGISVTSIGVGLDYSEAVLGALAIRSGGRFYHLQEPAQMVAILETELNALSGTVARGLILQVEPGPDVIVVSATGADLARRGRGAELRLGDMQGGQARTVVVNLRVPTTGGPVHEAARVALRYDLAAGPGGQRTADDAVSYRVATSNDQVEGSVNARYAVVVEQHRAALVNQQAVEMLGQGRNDGAGDVLLAQAHRMRSRARAIGGEAGRDLEQEAERVEGAERRARAARSQPARRAAQLDFNDDALDALGY